jgi:chromosome segregation ATPase
LFWQSSYTTYIYISSTIISINQNLQQALARAEAMIDDLTMQKLRLEQEKETLQIESDRLAARLAAKSDRSDELAHELARVRDELDARMQEIDQLKGKLDHDENSARAQVQNMERQVENLRELLELHEMKTIELNSLVVEKEALLTSEKNATLYLRDLLAKVGEKDDATEKLLIEVRSDREDLQDALDKAYEAVKAKERDLQESFQEIGKLRQELEDAAVAAKESERVFEDRRFQLESEVALVRLQLESMEGDVRTHVSVLTSRLDQLMAEKATVEGQLRDQKQKVGDMHRGTVKAEAETQQMQRAMFALAETVQYYMGRLGQQEELLNIKVQSWVDQSEARVQQAMAQVRTAAKAMHARNREIHDKAIEQYRRGGVTFEMMEDRLAQAQAALQVATRTAEEDASERDTLWQQLQESQADVDRLDRALQDLRRVHNLDKDGVALYNPGTVGIEELRRLEERLENAEQRAVEISTHGAKTFAQSARTIAFLEGECGRLKTLQDHFRYVNRDSNTLAILLSNFFSPQ